MGKPEQKLRYSVVDCVNQLGISRATFDRRVLDGKYRVIRDGSRVFMSHAQLVAAAAGDGNDT